MKRAKVVGRIPKKVLRSRTRKQQAPLTTKLGPLLSEAFSLRQNKENIEDAGRSL